MNQTVSSAWNASSLYSARLGTRCFPDLLEPTPQSFDAAYCNLPLHRVLFYLPTIAVLYDDILGHELVKRNFIFL